MLGGRPDALGDCDLLLSNVLGCLGFSRLSWFGCFAFGLVARGLLPLEDFYLDPAGTLHLLLLALAAVSALLMPRPVVALGGGASHDSLAVDLGAAVACELELLALGAGPIAAISAGVDATFEAVVHGRLLLHLWGYRRIQDQHMLRIRYDVGRRRLRQKCWAFKLNVLILGGHPARAVVEAVLIRQVLAEVQRLARLLEAFAGLNWLRLGRLLLHAWARQMRVMIVGYRTRVLVLVYGVQWLAEPLLVRLKQLEKIFVLHLKILVQLC